MNRRMAMGGDTSLNAPMREDGEGQWQDWLVDNDPLQDERARRDAGEGRSATTCSIEAMDDLNDREKHILAERRLADDPKTLEELSARSMACRASASARSRCARSTSCRRR